VHCPRPDAPRHHAFACQSKDDDHRLLAPGITVSGTGDTFVHANVDADLVAEFAIRIDQNISLPASDFVL
jgi:hypothetical protein